MEKSQKRRQRGKNKTKLKKTKQNKTKHQPKESDEMTEYVIHLLVKYIMHEERENAYNYSQALEELLEAWALSQETDHLSNRCCHIFRKT